MAYDILSDPEKRQVYDISGEEGIKGGRSADETEEYSESDDDEVSELSSGDDDDEELGFPQNTSFYGHSKPSFTNRSGTFGFSFSSFGFSHGFKDSIDSDPESESDHEDDSDIDSDEDSGVHFEQNIRGDSGHSRSAGIITSESEDDSIHESDDDILSDNDSVKIRKEHQSKYRNFNSRSNTRTTEHSFRSENYSSESEEDESESGKHDPNNFSEVHEESDDDYYNSDSPEVVESGSEEESYYHEPGQSFNHHYESSEPRVYEKEYFNDYVNSDEESEPEEHHGKFNKQHEGPDDESELEDSDDDELDSGVGHEYNDYRQSFKKSGHFSEDEESESDPDEESEPEVTREFHHHNEDSDDEFAYGDDHKHNKYKRRSFKKSEHFSEDESEPEFGYHSGSGGESDHDFGGKRFRKDFESEERGSRKYKKQNNKRFKSTKQWSEPELDEEYLSDEDSDLENMHHHGGVFV